jgi:formylglycine-generating enzyme
VLIATLAACAIACSHDLDAFQTTDGALDSAAEEIDPPDTFDDTSEPVDSEDSGSDSEPIDVEDTGPPQPEIGCTAIGPPGTICIPRATFSLGAINETACPSGGCASEQPEINVTVSAFFIDPHEVTVGRFRTWWSSPTRSWPIGGAEFFAGSKTLRWRNTGWPAAPTAPSIAAGCTWKGESDASNDDKPLNCVDWFTALGFCMSEGKRLPSEAEWELVASGGQDRLFPWSGQGTEGDSYTGTDCAHALNGGSCSPLTATPDSTVWGRTRYGVWNMAGSLAEWVVDLYTPDYATLVDGTIDPVSDPTTTATASPRLARGGSHMSPIKALRAAARPSASVVATIQDSQIGFRCAKRM